MDRTKEFLNSSKDFLNSNSFIAKLSFIILVIIAFIMLFNFSYWIMNMALSPSRSPYLLNGMKDAKVLKVIHQDVRQSGSIPIFRSRNQNNGVEMTWSTWIYIDDPTYNQNNASRYCPVFVKGSNTSTVGISNREEAPNYFQNSNAPGVYLVAKDEVNSTTFGVANQTNLITMNLVIMLDIFPFTDSNQNNIYNQKIIIEDFPIKKWVNLIIRCSTQNIVDVFINGSLQQRVKLYNIIRQNYDNVYINPEGGFDGFISNLRYFDYSIGTFEINQIVSAGPNLNMDKETNIKNSSPYYLSTKWLFGETNV